MGLAGERRAERHAGLRLLLDAAVGQREIEIRELVIGQGQANLGYVDRVDGCNRVPDPDVLADVDILGADSTGVRRHDVGALQIPRGALDTGFGGCHRGAGVLELRLAQRQLAWVATAERAPFPLCDLRLGLLFREPQSGLRELRSGAHERLLVVERIDLDQDVVRLEEPAFRKRGGDPGDATRDLGHQLALRARPDGALAGDAQRRVAERHLVYADAGWFDHRRQGLDRRPVHDHRDGAEAGRGDDDQGQQGLEYPDECAVHGCVPSEAETAQSFASRFGIVIGDSSCSKPPPRAR